MDAHLNPAKRRRTENQDLDNLDLFEQDPLSDSAIFEIMTQVDPIATQMLAARPSHTIPQLTAGQSNIVFSTIFSGGGNMDDIPLNPLNEMMSLRTELARLQVEVESKAGEASLLRQKLARAEFEQQNWRDRALNEQLQLKERHELDLKALRDELNRSNVHKEFVEFDVQKSQWQANKVSYSQLPPPPQSPIVNHQDLLSEPQASPINHDQDDNVPMHINEVLTNRPDHSNELQVPLPEPDRPTSQTSELKILKFPPHIIAKFNSTLDMLSHLSAPTPLFHDLLTSMTSASYTDTIATPNTISMLIAIGNVFAYLAESLAKTYPSIQSSTNIDPNLILINYPHQTNFKLMKCSDQLSLILCWYTHHSCMNTQSIDSIKLIASAVLQLICTISSTVVRNKVYTFNIRNIRRPGYLPKSKILALESGWTAQISILLSSIVQLQHVSQLIRSTVARVSVDYLQKPELQFLIKSSTLHPIPLIPGFIAQWLRLVVVSHEPILGQIVMDSLSPKTSTVYLLSQLLYQPEMNPIWNHLITMFHALLSHHPTLMLEYWNAVDTKGLIRIVDVIHDAANWVRYQLKPCSITQPSVNFKVLQSGLDLLCLICYHCYSLPTRSLSDTMTDDRIQTVSQTPPISLSTLFSDPELLDDVGDGENCWSKAAVWAQVRVFAIVELVKGIKNEPINVPEPPSVHDRIVSKYARQPVPTIVSVHVLQMIESGERQGPRPAIHDVCLCAHHQIIRWNGCLTHYNLYSHSLVLLNISDHYNRNRLQDPDSSGLVFGAFLGIHHDVHIEVFTSFEIKITQSQSKWVLDTDFFGQRLEQYKTVFPDYDFLGWYSTSITDPMDREIEIQRQFLTYTDLPIYGRFDPTLLYVPSTTTISSDQSNEISCARLPLILYESNDQSGSISFLDVAFKIDMGEAERIAVENVVKDSGSTGGPNGPLIAHLTSQRNALDMLHTRIKVILSYVTAVQSGQVQGDPALLRRIASLTHQLPCISGHDFDEQFLKDYNDVLLAFYLAMLTKTLHQTNNLVDKHLEVTAVSAPPHSEKGGGYSSVRARQSLRNRGFN